MAIAIVGMLDEREKGLELLKREIESRLDADIEIVRVENHINTGEFANAVVDALKRTISTNSGVDVHETGK